MTQEGRFAALPHELGPAHLRRACRPCRLRAHDATMQAATDPKSCSPYSVGHVVKKPRLTAHPLTRSPKELDVFV